MTAPDDARMPAEHIAMMRESISKALEDADDELEIWLLELRSAYEEIYQMRCELDARGREIERLEWWLNRIADDAPWWVQRVALDALSGERIPDRAAT